MSGIAFWNKGQRYLQTRWYVRVAAVALAGFLFIHVLQLYGVMRVEQVRGYVESVDVQSNNCRERLRAYWTGRTWNERIALGRKYANDPIYGLLVSDNWFTAEFISEVSWQSAQHDCDR